MIVRCKESFRQQIKEGSTYLVIEILITRTNNSISYRLIDSEGYPAIYDAEKFVIVSNDINSFAFSFNQEIIVFSPTQILNSELKEKNAEGFWGSFIEDDPESRKLLKKVVIDLAREENITPPTLI